MKIQHMPYIPMRITSEYGQRKTNIKGATTFHAGIDIGRDKTKYPNPCGSCGNVYAVADGEVVEVGENNARGKYVKIRHTQEYETFYQHLHCYSVKKGQKVIGGEIIAQMGATGVGDAPHLHFEIRKNKQCVNPMPYLKAIIIKNPNQDKKQMELQQRFHFSDETMEHITKYKHSEYLIQAWLQAKPREISDGTKEYIKKYKYGNEILRRVYGKN